jgi:cobalamin biosynthesis Mg chelatase CobN
VQVFETYEEYSDWYDDVHCKAAGIDAKNAVTVGLVLQKSHINTKDECHYTAVISELEARGAKVRHPSLPILHSFLHPLSHRTHALLSLSS